MKLIFKTLFLPQTPNSGRRIGIGSKINLSPPRFRMMQSLRTRYSVRRKKKALQNKPSRTTKRRDPNRMTRTNKLTPTTSPSMFHTNFRLMDAKEKQNDTNADKLCLKRNLNLRR